MRTVVPCVTGLAIGMLLALVSCAGGSKTAASPCLERCTNIQSSLDRSTCELQCQQVAAAPAPAPAPAPATTQPAPAPAPAPAASPPVVAQPSRPAQSTPTPAPTQPVTQPRPAGPTTVPSAPVGPSMAELQHQRSLCEATCDSEATPSDRATCRMQCAQITNRPTTTPPPGGIPTYVSPPATQPTTTGPARPAPADPRAISACLATCNDSSTPETDRATCRLNCNAVGTVMPAPSSYYVLGGTPPSDAEARAAAIRSSSGVVQGSPARPPTAQPANPQRVAACAATAQQCSTTCGAQLGPCNAGCDQGKQSATDRATCKLTCESSVDGCRDDCRIQEGTCRSRP